jgi:hypothetical protein
MAARSHVKYRRMLIAKMTTATPHETATGVGMPKNVARSQIEHREISPERAEPVEDQFGMAAPRCDAEPHRHLLNGERHQERQDDERNEESDAVGGSGGGIRQHARAVVLA